MGRDFHSKPFDEGTKLKLKLFEKYIKEWLPVFLVSPNYLTRINIFDFFCGPGQDLNKNPGSPLITIKALHPYFSKIIKNSLTVNLFLNEKSERKLRALQSLISTLKYDNKPINIEYSSYEFAEAFEKCYPLMKRVRTANFLFLDQTGIKQVTKEIFRKIADIPATDFLFFISSSTINRFYEHPEIRKFIKIPKATISDSKYLHIHRVVCDYYQSLVPQNREYYLASFSIKKGPNIYGLIFGTRHLLGIDKFLTKCWQMDPERGEANFDIDQDGLINKNQLTFFPDLNKTKKLRLFENDITHKILNKKLKTNKDIYKYTLQRGFLPRHSRDIIKQLISQDKLPKQRLKISYNSCKRGERDQPVNYYG